MAAGAPRHRAPKATQGSTGNVLQALGVAGGGLLAVWVLTEIAGGPAAPGRGGRLALRVPGGDTDRCRRRPWRRVRGPPTRAGDGHCNHLVRRGSPRPRPIGPTIPAPPSLTPAPRHRPLSRPPPRAPRRPRRPPRAPARGSSHRPSCTRPRRPPPRRPRPRRHRPTRRRPRPLPARRTRRRRRSTRSRCRRPGRRTPSRNACRLTRRALPPTRLGAGACGRHTGGAAERVPRCVAAQLNSVGVSPLRGVIGFDIGRLAMGKRVEDARLSRKRPVQTNRCQFQAHRLRPRRLSELRSPLA